LSCWVDRSAPIDPCSGPGEVRYTRVETITLKADGTYKSHLLEYEYGGYVRANGKGLWIFGAEEIWLKGEEFRTGWCTRCGEPFHKSRSSQCLLINVRYSLEEWKKKFHRKYDVQCYQCKKFGHVGSLCPERSCFICGKAGHIARKCPTPEKGASDKSRIEEPVRYCPSFPMPKTEIVYKEKA